MAATYDPNKLSAYKTVFGKTYTAPAPTFGADGQPVAAVPYSDKYGQSWDSDTQGKAFESWMDAGQYDASGGVGTVAPPAPSTPVTMTGGGTPDPVTGLIGTPTMVSDEVNKVIAEDSPLMQQARTRGLQSMAPRGLVNSSMAIGAADSAMYDAAVPIATANAAAKNNLLTQTNTINYETAAQNHAAAREVALRDIDNGFKAAMQNADAQTQAWLKQIDNDTKVRLANIEADYKTLIETSDSAAEIYKGTLAAISSVINNPDMDAASKAATINGLWDSTAVALNLIGSINGVDVRDLLLWEPVEAVP